MRALLLCLACLPLTACAGAGRVAPQTQEPQGGSGAGSASASNTVSEGAEGPQGEPQVSVGPRELAPAVPDSKWPPGPKKDDQKDWICLVSGEWLRGEFNSLNRGSVEFDSDELDTLSLDWDDVHELVGGRAFTAVLADRTQAVGRVRINRKQVFVTNRFGVFEYPRGQLMRLIPGRPEGVAFWTGRFGFNATARAGNTEQTDVGLTGSAKRRTADARTMFGLDTLISTIDSSETANYQTLSGRHDIYLSPKFFITPLGLELYRDRFQNLALRATPSAGAGYTFVSDGVLEWDGTASLGFRYTRFESVAVNEDDWDTTSTLILGTVLSADLTKKVEVGFNYQVQLGLEDIQDTNHDMGILLSLDFLWDLDLDLRLSWKRVGVPIPDSNGFTPKQDDFRLDVGFSWEF